MSIVSLRNRHDEHFPPPRTPTVSRSSEHADAPDDPVLALHHHQRQSSRLADRFYRLADDLSLFLESGQADNPREVIDAMKDAEQMRRSALESVAQIGLVLTHLQKQATVGAEDRGARVHQLALVKSLPTREG